MHEPRSGHLALLLTLATLASCGAPDDPVCVRARILPIAPDMITRSGRTLDVWSDWSVGQIELDGSVTTVTSLDVDLDATYRGDLEHDPVSGRMWLLATDDERAGWLYQFDAAGEVEWAIELVDFEGPVTRGSLLYHDDSIVIALTIDPVGDEWRELVVQRRNLAGESLWTRTKLPTEDDGVVFAYASLVGVSGDVLSMIATPPLIDYGPSYPLTLDVETGAAIWLGEGHDPIDMIASDEHLFLAWTEGPFYDLDQPPEDPIEIAPLSSSLQRVTPSGAESIRDEVEWPKRWRRGGNDTNLGIAWMGERVVTLVAGSNGRAGVTVHANDGTLECQAELGIEIDRFYEAIGIEGREQWLIHVVLGVGEPDYGYYEQYERRVLLLEPL